MSSLFRIYVIVLFLLITAPLIILAQSSATDASNGLPSASNETYMNAVNIYKNTIGRNSMIFSGTLYNDSHWGINGDPYFLRDTWTNSTIVYEGHSYDSVQVKYEINNDLVIIKYVDKIGYEVPIQLDHTKIGEFWILGHRFVRIVADSLSTIKTGFFDVLYDGGEIKALAKRQKTIKTTTELNQLIKEYILNETYYIFSGTNYFPVKGKKSILEVLSDRKNEIKAFMKKNRGRFKNDHERQLIETVQYYDSIVNNSGS